MLEVLSDPSNYPFWILILFIIAGAIAIMSRPFSTYVKFVYPNAKFEAIGNPYIDEKLLSNISESKSLNDFTEKLNSSKDYDIKGQNANEIHKSLDDSLIKTIEMMRKDSSKKLNKFYDLYLEKIDIYLIKNEIKNKLINNKVSNQSIENANLIKTKNFIKDVEESERDKIAELLKNYGFSYDFSELINEKEVDFIALDNQIDKYILDRFKDIKLPYKCGQPKQHFVKILTDMINIKSLLRAKQIDLDSESCLKLFVGEGQEIANWKFKEISEVDQVSQVISALEGTTYFNILKDNIENYNKEKSVQILENALDSIFLKLVKDISIKNYVTIGPTLRFLVAKEFEIKNLKIISKGIYEDFSNEVIKSLTIKEAS